MLQLADGERAAFDPIYDALWPLVHRFTTRALGDGPDAEDAAQVALMKVFSQASRFDEARDVVAWSLGIAAYECKTVRQKQRRRREAPVSTEHAEQSTSPERNPEDAAISRQLESAALDILGSLSASDVETLHMLVDDGHVRSAVAPATFRKRVSRALARLRVAWSSRHGD